MNWVHLSFFLTLHFYLLPSEKEITIITYNN
jgi:hypothetical protein